MIYQILADLILVIHLLFVAFVVAGGLLVMKKRWIALLHLPAAAWGVLIELMGWYCPLTPLENHFRHLEGSSGFEGGFVEHYLVPVIYPDAFTRELQIILGTLVIVVNLVIYGLIIFNSKK
ncbi:MAG: DUF2784 domain-containing protein [Bacteroidales bacterium]|nr:DUF2784 domain-containing protein [Bacteroidales bacterium]